MTDFVTVPVEPTEEMLAAFDEIAKWLASSEGTAYAAQAAFDGALGEPYWKAMLAARPVDEVRPIAYACRTCNKMDWADTKEQLAQPEHVSYRGVDIGECKGKMIPLYAK